MIHALGDSYAHTFENNNGVREGYTAPYGHAKVGHWPDAISNWFGGYDAYTRALYDDLNSWPKGTRYDPNRLLNEVQSAANGFAARPDTSDLSGSNELQRELDSLKALALGAGYNPKMYMPDLKGNIDTTMWSPGAPEIISLINKMKRCCCSADPLMKLPESAAGIGHILSGRNQLLLDELRGVAPPR